MTDPKWILDEIAYHEKAAADCSNGDMMSLREAIQGEAFHRAQIARLEKMAESVAVLDDWQPIESAPRDGSPFLGAIHWSDTGEWEILRMHWVEHAGRFGDATYAPFIADQEQPTHWQPLPAPPPVG